MSSATTAKTRLSLAVATDRAYDAGIRAGKAPLAPTRAHGSSHGLSAPYFGDSMIERRDTFSPITSRQADMAAKVGDVWDCSPIRTALTWYGNNYPHASLEIRDRRKDGEVITEHPYLSLLRRPCPYLSYSTVAQIKMLSYWCGGSVYFRKVRNGMARPVELMWLPHWEVKPCRLPSSNNWVDHYEWRVQGSAKPEIIPAADMVHLRCGIDPRNPLMGLSPLRGLLLSVFNESEVNRFAAALMQNLGLPGAIYRHKPQEIVGDDGRRELIGLGQEQAERIKQRHREVFSGERLGDTQILDGNWEEPTFPDMKIDTAFIEKTKDISEVAVANAFSLPASLLGFLAGMKHGNTRASHEDARKQGYQEGLVPLQSSIASDYDLCLMPDFGLDPTRYYLAYEYSGVSVMADDLLACARRASILYTGGLATQNEGRSIANLPAVTGGDVFHVKPSATEASDKADPMPEPSAQ